MPELDDELFPELEVDPPELEALFPLFEELPPEPEDDPPEPDDELFPVFELFPVPEVERVPELEEPPEPDDELPESSLQTPHEASQLPANQACPQKPQETASLHDSEGRGVSVQTVLRLVVLVAELPPAPLPPAAELGFESELPPEAELESESEFELLSESELESELPSESEALSAIELLFAVLLVPFDVPPAPFALVLAVQSQLGSQAPPAPCFAGSDCPTS
ncbi:MAG TPA: hypothetical protein VKP30_25975 [Polyangiaceae bacterium]|nr:hypothetical protein [Polyangiaceae bacterium]